MTSQSLYRKWRSQTFGDLIGQEPIIRTLKNALSSGNIAHAYLFTGPRGTGKTSTARLLAKTVNCANPVNGEPCNKCQQCREITAGNSFNVIEIDAASNRGIDSIRDLRERIMVPPSTGKYKVYVLDEAHMLTTEAFNALLKTLEEPPDYAIFVLATTDVHKMLPTVLSRCQRFDFKRITTRQIVEHLNFVAEQEHVKIERAAAELIARAAAGGMRDALSLLDQAIAYAGEEISQAQVQAMLGLADPYAVQKLITHVSQLDSAAVLHLIHELSEAGADLRQLNMQVGEYWRSLMLARAGADIATVLDLTEDETREIQQMTRLFELEELTEIARIFAQNELVQKNQGTPQLGLELAFLQSIELHRRTRSGQLLHLNDTLSFNERTEVANHAAAAPEVAVANIATSGSENVFLEGKDKEPSLTIQQVKDAWEKIKRRVRGRNQAGPKTAAYLNDYTIVGVESGEDGALVVIQAAHTLHYKYLHESEYRADVEWALSLEFNQKCLVRLLAPGQPLPVSPAQAASSHLANTAVPPSQRSTHRERSAATPPPGASKHIEQEDTPELAQEATFSRMNAPGEDHSSPVVKKSVVRENTTMESPEASQSSLEAIKQKVNSDPVVQEVIRTFTAKIVDIRTK